MLLLLLTVPAFAVSADTAPSLDDRIAAVAVDGPFQVRPLAVISGAGFPDQRQTLQFEVVSSSAEQIDYVGVELRVFRSTGDYKFVHGFTAPVTLHAGTSDQVVYALPAELVLESGDYGAIVPLGARMPDREWRIEYAALERAASTFAIELPSGRTIAKELSPRTALRGRFGPVTNSCGESFCVNAEARCEARCLCGVQNFSCSTGATCSYSCSCFACPM